MHPAALPIEALLADCDEIRTRRGGPGGQHRNKVSTAVVIRHRPTGITAEASERRSQTLNRTVAIRRLRLRLAIEVRTPLDRAAARAAPDASHSSARPRAATGDGPAAHADLPHPLEPSARWSGRRSGTGIRVAADHDDYPALVAEALDRLDATRGSLPLAAGQLGVSGSQLTRLLARQPSAWTALQSLRRRHGLPPVSP
jgi:hypothetical protein